MEYTIHSVNVADEFKDCPTCGYRDGFHTMLKKRDGKFRRLYICPSCHDVFDVNINSEEIE